MSTGKLCCQADIYKVFPVCKMIKTVLNMTSGSTVSICHDTLTWIGMSTLIAHMASFQYAVLVNRGASQMTASVHVTCFLCPELLSFVAYC